MSPRSKANTEAEQAAQAELFVESKVIPESARSSEDCSDEEFQKMFEKYYTTIDEADQKLQRGNQQFEDTLSSRSDALTYF